MDQGVDGQRDVIWRPGNAQIAVFQYVVLFVQCLAVHDDPYQFECFTVQDEIVQAGFRIVVQCRGGADLCGGWIQIECEVDVADKECGNGVIEPIDGAGWGVGHFVSVSCSVGGVNKMKGTGGFIRPASFASSFALQGALSSRIGWSGHRQMPNACCLGRLSCGVCFTDGYSRIHVIVKKMPVFFFAMAGFYRS